MNELIRNEKFLGSDKIFVGDKNHDLILETLGKVYIKTGNNSKLLNEVFKNLDKLNKLDISDLLSKVRITDNLENYTYPGDGILIFSISDNALYMSYDLRYILILDSVDIEGNLQEFIDESKGYVKKSGDTMTGALTIKAAGAPLIIASKELVENLNVQYLNGYTDKELAKKYEDEYIYGNWTFHEETTFKKNTYFNKDIKVDRNIIVKQDISSPIFNPGFLGNGWKLDASTNMLTVDYLVVRKAMMVYELIINQIRATNGSLWVTDASKVKEVQHVLLLDLDSDINTWLLDLWYVPYRKKANGEYDNIKKTSVLFKHLLNSLGEIPPDFVSDTSSNIEDSYIFYDYGYVMRIDNMPNIDLDFTDLESLNNNQIKAVRLFERNTSLLPKDLFDNKVYNNETTPRYYHTGGKEFFLEKSEILDTYIYYKYFGIREFTTKDLYVITLDGEGYPTILEGDILRCLKFLKNIIKYYDALVISRVGDQSFLILLAPSVFDKYTKEVQDGETLKRIEELNTNYSKTNPFDDYTLKSPEVHSKLNEDPSAIMATVTEKDDLVRIGSILDVDRLGSIYITSSDTFSPFLQTIDNVDRPDYGVLYTLPKFVKNFKGFYYKKTNDLYDKENSDLLQIGNVTYKLSNDRTIIHSDLFEYAIEINKENKYKAPYKNTTKVKVGRLDGMYNDLLGDHQPNGYGLYGENVYLTGEFILNNGQSVVEFTKDAINMEISGMVTTNYALNSKGPMYINYVDPNDSLTTKDISETRNYLILDFIIPALNKTEMTVSWKLNPDNIILDVYYINISEPILRDKKGFIHFDSDQIISFKNKGQQIVRDKPMILLNNYNAILFMKKEFEAGGTISEIMVQKGNHKTPWEPAQMDKVASSFKMDENGILLLGKEILLKGKIRFEFFELKFKDKLQLFDVDVANMPNGTTINGGLISTGILAAGTLDKENNQYVVTSGISGILNSNKPEESISYWAGGPPVDITKDPKYNETDPDKNKKIENVASALIRMDGTGYFAKGNLSWNKDGTLNLVSDTITINGLDTLAVWVKAMLDKKILVANNISDAVEENVLYIYLSPTNNDL